MKINNIENILKTKLTVLPNATGYIEVKDEKGKKELKYVQTVMTLQEFLDLGIKYKEAIDILRSYGYHSEMQLTKKPEFPCCITGGVCEENKQDDNSIIIYSNLLFIDVDKIDNPDIDMNEKRKELFDWEYSAAVLNSISGMGYYVVIPVEDSRYTKEYYKYLVNLFKNKFGLVVDPKCKNIARKRFISYDDYDKWIKSGDIWVWNLKYQEKDKKEEIKPLLNNINLNNNNNNNNSEYTRKAIWKILNDGYTVNDYGAWYHTGTEFANFEDGEDMFIKLCDNYGKQNSSPNNKWKQCLKNPADIEEVNRKWQGMAKNKYGKNWWK